MHILSYPFFQTYVRISPSDINDFSLRDLPTFYLPPYVHIVPCENFHRIRGAPLETFPSVKYDAPEEVGGDRKSFDSPIRK